MLLAGVFLSVAIVTLSSVIVSLANADIAIDKTTFIKSDYDNVRKEFGMALKDKLAGKLSYGDDFIETYFQDIRDTFVFFIESLNGNYFDADYLEVTYTNDEPDGIKCYLRFGNGKEFVSEIIEYDIY